MGKAAGAHTIPAVVSPSDVGEEEPKLMCGICGAAWTDPDRAITPNLIEAMSSRIIHRGPDDAGLYHDQHAALGFRRLSILDLAFIMKNEDGSVTEMEISDLGGESESFTVFEGASSGILDESDHAEAAEALETGKAAALLVYENSWAGPFASAVRRSGGQLVASGRIPVQALIASLDSAEA